MFFPSMVVGSGGQLVELVGGNLVDLATNPDDAQVRYRLLTTGEEQIAVGLGAAFSTIGTWLLHGPASDYQAQYISPGGDPTTPDALGVPHDLTSTVEFGYLQASIGSQSASGSIEIIRKVTGKLLVSETLNLTANVDP